MKDILKLTANKNHQLESAKDIREAVKKDGGTLSKEQREKIEEHLRNAKDIDAEITEIKAQDELFAEIDNGFNEIEKNKKAEFRNAPIAQPTRQIPVADDDITNEPKKATRWFRTCKTQYFPNTEQGHADALESGMWFRACYNEGDYKAQRWCKENNVQYRTMNEASSTLGGALIPTPLADQIITLRDTYGTIAQDLKWWPMTTKTQTFPKWTSGPQAYYIGEQSALTQKDISTSQVVITAVKLAAMTTVSNELLNDSIEGTIALGDWIVKNMAWALSYMMEWTLTYGDNSAGFGNQYGFMTLLNDGTRTGSTTSSAGSTFAAITNTEMATMFGLIPAYVVRTGSPKLYCSQQFFAQVCQRLALVAGGNTVETLGGGLGYKFGGWPIVISPLMPTTSPGSGKAFCAFGDLNFAGTYGEITGGLKVMSSDQRYMELDETAFRVIQRFGTNFHNIPASSTAGGVVALLSA